MNDIIRLPEGMYGWDIPDGMARLPGGGFGPRVTKTRTRGKLRRIGRHEQKRSIQQDKSAFTREALEHYGL